MAATVYVKNTSGTDVYYESGATSCDDVTAADTSGDLEAALTAAGANGVLNICAGTYAGAMIDAADGLDDTAVGQTINGVGLAIIDATTQADTAISLTQINGTVQDLTIYAASNKIGVLSNNDGQTLNRLIIYAGNPLRFSQAQSTANNLKLYGLSQAVSNVFVTGSDDTNSPVINNSLLQGGVYMMVSKGTLTLNNSIVTGMQEQGIITEGTSTTVLNNTAVYGNQLGLDSTDHTIHRGATSAVTINYSLVTPNPINGDNYFLSAGITDGGGNIYVSPQIVTPRYIGAVSLIIDDKTQLTSGWFETIADKAAAYGWTATLALNYTDIITSDEWDKCAELINEGHEIAAHARHHADMADLNAIDIQYTGDASTATMTVDVATNSITTTLAGDQTDGSTNLSIDISNLSYDSILNIYTYIDAQTGYSASTGSTIVSGTDGCSDAALGIELADIVGQDIKTAEYTVLFDATRYYAEEITNCKSDIETALAGRVDGGYTVKSFVFPYNSSSEAAQDALKAAGFIGARAGSSGDHTMEDLNIFDVYGLVLSTAIGTTNIERNIAGMAETLNQGAYYFGLHAHSSTDYSAASWDSVLSALSKTNLTVLRLNDFFEHINGTQTGILPTGTDADADGERWTRTFTDNANYNLNPGSPAINAGTSAPYVGSGVDHYDLHPSQVWDGALDTAVGYWVDGVDIGAYGSEATPPEVASVSIDADGTTLMIVFDENVSQGTGYDDADWNIDCNISGDDIGITYVSGDGTGAHTYTIDQTIGMGEVCNIDFNGDVDSMEDESLNDLVAIISGAIINGSTIPLSAHSHGSMGIVDEIFTIR